MYTPLSWVGLAVLPEVLPIVFVHLIQESMAVIHHNHQHLPACCTEPNLPRILVPSLPLLPTRHPVPIVGGRFLEPLPASFALERRLAGMGAPPVIVQRHLLVESFRTELTRELLDRVVRLPVPCQVRLHRKPGSALHTNVPLLRAVFPGHVRIQVAPGLLLFATDLTLQLRSPGRSLLAVLRVLVVLHLAVGEEPFRADRALLVGIGFVGVGSVDVQLEIRLKVEGGGA